jgi:N-ethylmaleimide reductase
MNLFSSYAIGGITLPNRMAMAPMTRCRAVNGNVPNPLAAVYYAQRATAGLIITEGSQISPQGVGYVRTPGIHSAEQVAGWKQVCDAVHRAGGRIFLQLWHVGRASHPDFIDGELPVAPSTLPVEGEVFTAWGLKKMVPPRTLDTSELPGIVEQYRAGAKNAKDAGFDGVEIHGANGYLLDQFLRDGSNRRTDAYGGSVENRARLPLEVAEAVIGIWGEGRVGYRISPHYSAHSMSDSDPLRTFSYLARKLNSTKLAYLHLVESLGGRTPAVPEEQRLAPVIRGLFKRALMLNGGYDAAAGHAAIEQGRADLISFGTRFLANPDLPERLMKNAPLNQPDQNTYYAGEGKGYVDYPTLAEQ